MLAWLGYGPITIEMVMAFLRDYGYIILFIGTLLEGETIVVVAGALAHLGVLDLPAVILVSWAGSVINDQALFQVGHHYGEGIIARLPLFLRRHVGQAERLIRRFGDAVTLLFRFVYGARTITPILLGTHRYPLRRYIWMNMVAAAVWAGAIASLGYVLGASLHPLLREVHNGQLVILGVIVALGIGFWLWGKSRR